MQILFQHNFEFPVWRIISSSTSIPTWVVELRNASKNAVEYHFIDQEFKVTKLKTILNWWSGIECVLGQTIVFHGYLQQDLPIHKGIAVFDSISNKLSWENDYVTFISTDGSFIKVKLYAGSVDTSIILDIKKGEETDKLNLEEISNSFQTNIIGQGQPYFEEIIYFIKKFTHLEPIKLCEYSEKENNIIVSYYVQNEGNLENYLLAADLNGEELLHICLQKELKGVATGTFSVSNSFLNFVKDRNELIITDLN